MRRSISILFLLCALSSVKGQDVFVSSEFDTSSIYIGDQIHYNIIIDQPSGLSLELKPIRDTLCKNIEILSGPVTDTSIMDGMRLKIRSKYLITSFDSGFYEVPPFYAELKNENGIKRFFSDYARIEVMRVSITPQDTAAKIFDIIGPYRAPLTLGEMLPWILLSLLATLAIAGIVLLVRRYRKPEKGTEAVINPDPAHIIAFRDLEKLRDEQLWQKGETKAYYSRLTGILRQYLEDRYGVFSLEMTTSETLSALLRKGFKRDNSFSDLKSILTGSDLVKFAKYKPDPSENEVHFENSWKFVDTTKIVEENIVPGGTEQKGEEDKS